MKVRREWLGGSEVIDLDTDEGWRTWVRDVHQDEDAAEAVMAEVADAGVAIVNEDQPEYFERYTRLDGPVEPEAIDKIVDILASQPDWSGDTLSDIANVLTAAGLLEVCDECGLAKAVSKDCVQCEDDQ
jgi:hypothetical protein